MTRKSTGEDRERRIKVLEKVARQSKKDENEKTILAEIGRIISSTLDIDEVYERFAIEARKLIPFDRLSVSLLIPQTENVRVTYVSGMDLVGREKGHTVPINGTLNEFVIRSKKGGFFHPQNARQVVNSYPALLAAYRAGVRSMMSVPLISRAEAIGGLHFGSKTREAYAEADLSLAQRIGNQIAGAIANAQLFEDLKRSEQENATIAEIGRIISSTFDIDEVYERFSAEVGKLIPFDRISIALLNGDQGTGTVTYLSGLKLDETKKGQSFPLAGSTLETVMCRQQNGFIFHPHSLKEVEDLHPRFVDSYKRGVRSVIVVPLTSSGKVIGALSLRSITADLYTANDLNLAWRIGNQIAGAIANAGLYADLKSTEKLLKNTLDQLESRVQERTLELKEINTALGVLLKKRENDRRELEEALQANINQLIMPFLEKLQTNNSDTEKLAYLNILKVNLSHIISPFVNVLSNAYKSLTPKEVQIAELIKQGKSSKEIAEVFGLSVCTIITHRNNIRKKLKLTSENINLRSHLNSLA